MKLLRLLSLILLLPFISEAQQKMLTVEDVVLKQRSSLGPEKLIQLSWIQGTADFAWVVKVNGKEYIVKENAITLKRDTIIGIDEFKAIPNMPKMERFPVITWVDQNSFRFVTDNGYYLVNLQEKKVSILVEIPKDAENVDFETTTNSIAYTNDNNIFIINASGKKEQLTTDGTYGLEYGEAVHRNEFGILKGTFWSGKGNKLAYYKMLDKMVTDYPILDLETKPASPKNIKYPMAGNASHEVSVMIYDAKTKKQIQVQTGLPAEQYLTNIAWSPDEVYLYIALLNRDQNEMKMNVYDATTGNFVKTLFTETHPKYVEPEHPVIFLKNNPSQFLWFSKRDGFNHLYLYDVNGKMISQLTKGKYDITDFLGFNKKGDEAYYIAASVNGLDRIGYSVNIKSGKSTSISHISGVHSVLVNEDGYILDSYSNTTTPRKITLADRRGKELQTLLTSINPIADYTSCGIRIFTIPSKDNTTSLNCRIFYPPNFDSTKKYPVVVYLYGGPHAQMITNSWLGGADMWLYYMAQQGYVVFTLDNRGSGNRGVEFENATFRKLGTLEREDQLVGVEFLKKQSYVDASRMGVFGWSFGGFMSIGMMTRTDVFKAGVAGGPVIDWGMYEIMYTERYMDKPQDNPEGYKDANLLNYIKGLKGKLLVIHGTSDDVVLWQHSLNYIKKSVDEGVQVDYFVYPAHKHNVLGKDRVHLMQKITDYFKQNL